MDHDPPTAARSRAASRSPDDLVGIVADCERLIDLAGERLREGDLRSSGEAIIRAGELARRARRPDLLAAAALVVSGVDNDLLNAAIEEMAQEAIDGLGDQHVPLQARLHGQKAVTLSHLGRLDDAAAASERALDLAEATHDAAALAAAIHARQMVVLGLGRPDELLRLGARMLELQGAGDATGNALLGHLWRCDGFLQRGETAAARREIDALDVLGGRRNDPLVRWHALRARAGLDQAVGRLAQAEHEARLAVDALPLEGHMIARGSVPGTTRTDLDRPRHPARRDRRDPGIVRRGASCRPSVHRPSGARHRRADRCPREPRGDQATTRVDASR